MQTRLANSPRHSHSLRRFIPRPAEKCKIGEKIEDAPHRVLAAEIVEGRAPDPTGGAVLTKIHDLGFQRIIADRDILLDARDQIFFERGLREGVPRAQPAAPQLHRQRKQNVAMDLAMRGRRREFERDAV